MNINPTIRNGVKLYIDKLNDTNTAEFSIDPRGRKYARVVKHTELCAHAKTAHSFINTTTGELHKPSGWKTPTRTPKFTVADINSVENIFGSFTEEDIVSGKFFS